MTLATTAYMANSKYLHNQRYCRRCAKWYGPEEWTKFESPNKCKCGNRM